MTDDARVVELEFLAMLDRQETPMDVSDSAHERLDISPRRFADMVLALVAENSVTGERPRNPSSDVSPRPPRDPKVYFWAASERTVQSIFSCQPYQLYLTHFGRLRLARLRSELDRGRIMDPTGILIDLRHVERDLRVRFAMARPGSSVSVMMADLDHFKGVNDTLGHDRGDEALRRYFSVLRDIVAGESGDAYRRGGDETLAILVGADQAHAAEVAEIVRRAVETEFMNFDEKLSQPPTVSIGVATFLQATKPVTVLKRVDELLYQAKQKGKNRVVGEALEAAGHATANC